MTYLEIILQIDNILIIQLTADFLSSRVPAWSRIGKVSRLEQLQKRPCDSDVIAEAHSSAKWSVYWCRHFCCSYQAPRRGVKCSGGYLPMHLGRNESNIIKFHWLQKLRVILGCVRTRSKWRQRRAYFWAEVERRMESDQYVGTEVLSMPYATIRQARPASLG